MVLRVCFCLGVKASNKTFAGQVIKILGVASDFSLIGIKKERRDDLATAGKHLVCKRASSRSCE